MRRLRIAHVLVQPILVWDDGEELVPGPSTTAQQVPLSGLDGMADRLRAEVVMAEAQLNVEQAEQDRETEPAE